MREGLHYKGRPVCSVLRPFFVARSQYDRLQQTSRDARDALLYIAGHALQSERHRAALGLRPAEQDLLFLYQLDEDAISIGRMDGFLDSAGRLRMLEYNGESPGGIAYGDALGTIFDTLPTIQALRERFDLERIPVVPSVIESFVERYRIWAQGKGQTPVSHPSVAIVDTRGQPTYREFELFAESFEAQGMHTVIAAPDELRIEGGRLVAGSIPIDIIYRRLVTPDLMKLKGEADTLIEAVRQNIVHVCNSFGGHLLSHKGLFAIFSDPEFTPQEMDSDLRQTLTQVIPWTRFVTQSADLANQAIRDQERLVLKPVSDYGGHGVVLGWEVDKPTWATALDHARQHQYILQERIEAPTARFPIMTGKGLQHRKLLFDTCPYVLGDDHRHGMGVRISEEAILNMAAGAGSAIPVYVVNGC